MDWSKCPDVESHPDVLSGVPVVVHTRVPADSLVEHVESGYTPEEIALDIFPSVPVSRVRRIIEFAEQHAAHPA